jgi:cell division transport system permease protein
MASFLKVASMYKGKNQTRFLNRHHKAWHDALTQILQTPIKSLITCTVMAITLLLTSTLLVAVKSLQAITHYIHASSPVTLYLKSDAKESETRLWIEKLQQEPMIKNVTYISAQQALQELAAQNEYKDILSEVTKNPIPPVILIKLASSNPAQVQTLVTALKNSPLVSAINVDFAWLQRLATLIKLANRISYTLTMLFAIGGIFIISYAIQEATERNSQEMQLLQLMGASSSYIRRPFLYLGTFLGLGAGLVTLLLLALLFLPLKQPLNEVLQTYQLTAKNWFFNIAVVTKVLIQSILLGWLGAWLAFYRNVIAQDTDHKRLKRSYLLGTVLVPRSYGPVAAQRSNRLS